MNTKYLNRFLWIYMAIMLVMSSYIYGFVVKANGDNVEHLHASWLVWRGFIPYKDFFQHHNPLTWYLSAPLVAAMINNFTVFAVFNIIGLIALYFIAYYQCKIFLLNGGKHLAAMFLGAILVSDYSLLWSTDFRPDTFMFWLFYMGLYYLFLYGKEQQNRILIYSFLCFFISFMFTQKVLMHLIVPAFLVLYWLFSGRMKFIHLVYASIAPLLLLLAFLGYLYHHDTLKIYWLSNYPFNTYIPKIFEQQRIIFPPREFIDFYLMLPLGVVSAAYFLFKGSEIEKTFSLMFWLEVGFRMFYFSAFLHYVIFWLMLSIMLSVMYFNNYTKDKQNFMLIGLVCVFLISRTIAAYVDFEWTAFHYILFMGMIASLLIVRIAEKYIRWQTSLSVIGIIYILFASWYNYHTTYKREIKTHEQINGHEIAFDILTPCDYALNGYYSTYNLKAKDVGYYSILLGQIDVLGEKSGIAKRDNLNELIRAKKPKLISAGIFWDTYWEQRGKKIPAHTIDQNLINAYYDYSGMGDIHILKPQYQKHTCVYNGKDWVYMD